MQGFDKLPVKYNSNVQSIVDKNPGWEVKKWDDSSIKEELRILGQKYLDKYNSFKLLHQKVDFGRYAILYNQGGASIDIDAFALKSLDEVPSLSISNFIVSYNSTNSFINNATILVSKNNNLIKGFIDSIVANDKVYFGEMLTIAKTTGPLAFTKFLKQYKNEITILDPSYLEPCSSMNKYCKVKPNSILDHRHELSWINPFYQKLAESRYFLIKHKKSILVLLIIIFIFILIFRRK